MVGGGIVHCGLTGLRKTIDRMGLAGAADEGDLGYERVNFAMKRTYRRCRQDFVTLDGVFVVL